MSFCDSLPSRDKCKICLKVLCFSLLCFIIFILRPSFALKWISVLLAAGDQGEILIHIGFCALLTSAMLPQQASPLKSLLLDMFICMMNTQFFGHSWLHFVVLVARWSWCREQDEKCRANSLKSSCSSVHKEEQDSPLSWWGCSLRKFILYCVQHNFILLPFVMYFLVA